MKKLFKIALSIIVVMSFTSIALGGSVNVGIANLTDGHSELDTDRCINDGWALDIGYDFTTWKWEPKSWFALQLTPGALFTYSNYETAERERVGAPEFNQKRESSFTLLGVAKPSVRVWRFTAYKLFGIGGDWMQSDRFDWGYLTEGYGLEFKALEDENNSISIGLDHRKFQRSDNGHYSYITGRISFAF